MVDWRKDWLAEWRQGRKDHLRQYTCLVLRVRKLIGWDTKGIEPWVHSLAMGSDAHYSRHNEVVLWIIMAMDFPKTKGLLIVVSVATALWAIFRHFPYTFPTFSNIQIIRNNIDHNNSKNSNNRAYKCKNVVNCKKGASLQIRITRIIMK